MEKKMIFDKIRAWDEKRKIKLERINKEQALIAQK